MDQATRDCLDRLSVGVLICHAEDLSVVFANATAQKWFGTALAGRPLPSVVAAVSAADLAAHLARGERYSVTGETSPPRGRRIHRSCSTRGRCSVRGRRRRQL